MGRRLTFDWDEHNIRHIARHDVSPAEFEDAFSQPMIEHIVERGAEKRIVAAGRTKMGRYLFLAYTMRGGHVRPVTAYPLPRKNRKNYDEKIKGLI